jgi:uncharacterized membrane protein
MRSTYRLGPGVAGARKRKEPGMSETGGTLELIAAVYPNTFEARARLNDLVKLHDAASIELVDAALLVRQYSGKLDVEERAELTPRKGAKRGALIGAVIGVVFPPSILAGAALGAAAGAVVGKATDQGIANQMLETLGAELKPGRSAVIAVVDHEWYGTVVNAIEGYDRVLVRTIRSDELASSQPD